MGQYLRLKNNLLFKIQIRKESYELCDVERAFNLFTVAARLVSGNLYGLSFIYWTVKSSAFKIWNV